jgi:serine/threonine protein kinase
MILAVADNGPTLDAGARVGRYTVTRTVYAHGNSQVYEVCGPDGVRYALKMLPPAERADRDMRERLRREWAYALSVASRRVASIKDAVYDDDEHGPYLVQEFIDGETLRDRLKRQRQMRGRASPGGGLPPSEFARFALGLLEGLTDIHAAGVVHRDLKPSNVMISPERGPVLIDFSIAWRDGAEPITKTGSRLLTFGYGSPEQHAGKRAGPKSDVFSAAVVLAEACTGRHPFGPGPREEREARVKAGDADLTGVPDWLRGPLAKCLATKARNRPTVRKLLNDVSGRYERFAGRETLVPRPDPIEPISAVPRRVPVRRLLRMAIKARVRRLVLLLRRGRPIDWADDVAFARLLRLVSVAGVIAGLIAALALSFLVRSVVG